MPLDLSHAQRLALEVSGVLLMQAPGGMTEKQLRAFRLELEKRVGGLPGDVVFALNAVRMLAEQGNATAADVFASECDRLGLTERHFSIPK